MGKRVGVLRFPGTNCDRDVFEACVGAGHQAEWLWYMDRFDQKKYEAIFLPGGFSFGDYLRCGALAARSPAMESVREAAAAGKPVLGICNGFQILCESGLLPGALMRNKSLRFIDQWVELKTATANPFFKTAPTVKLPIARAEGRYHISEDGLKGLQDNGQIWMTYQNNPNGAIRDIAGVMNVRKNIAALMPHPERAFHKWMGGTDGQSFFQI